MVRCTPPTSAFSWYSLTSLCLFLFSDLMFLETSAKTGEGVEDVFFKCSKTILNRIDAGRINPDNAGSGIQPGYGRKPAGAAGATTLGSGSASASGEGGCC
jgi:hypothetical protein